MIDVVATRPMTLGDREYQQGDLVPMPLQQFQDLEATGFVVRAPAKKAVKRKAKAAKAPAAKPAITDPVEPIAEPMSSDIAD